MQAPKDEVFLVRSLQDEKGIPEQSQRLKQDFFFLSNSKDRLNFLNSVNILQSACDSQEKGLGCILKDISQVLLCGFISD